MGTHDGDGAHVPTESANGETNGTSSRRLLAAHGALTAVPRFASQSVITTVVDHDCRVMLWKDCFP